MGPILPLSTTGPSPALAVRGRAMPAKVAPERLRKELAVALWLVLIIAGLVLLVLGLAGLGQFFVYVGLIVAVIGVVLVVVGRGNRNVGGGRKL